MQLQRTGYPLRVTGLLATTLQKVLNGLSDQIPRGGIQQFTLKFVSACNAEPVEKRHLPVDIVISSEGLITNITEYRFFGVAPNRYLDKDLEFNFKENWFALAKQRFTMEDGKIWFRDWQTGFVRFCRRGVYKYSVEF